MEPTRKGDALALKLSPIIGNGREARGVCALLCRHAATLHRLAEDDCNGHPANENPYIPAAVVSRYQALWEARIERDQERTRRRMIELTAMLPGAWRLNYETDPRGCSVLIYEGDLPVRGDSWDTSVNGFCIENVS